ncbi:ROK family protein [Microbacterium sediminicola]|uniref:ROK family protein n=1 Tax=Microbacterium sediminicola TaxID=415210 RepID=A0ABN2HI70_9MICO
MRLGLDVGGTKTDAVAVGEADEILARVRTATGWGPDAVVDTVVQAVHSLLSEGRFTLEKVASIGIGIPGQVDAATGRVTHAVNLGVAELDLAGAVRRALGAEVRVENDVKAAAVGAARALGAVETTAFLNLGTGIAAGVVTDRGLWRGARGAAGEIGHLSVDPAGPTCRCGQSGCIEALAGGGAVAQRWGRPGALPIRDIFDAADAGNSDARELRVGIARGVAAAVRVLVLTADVETVVLGGGISALGERLRGDVVAELERSAAASAFLSSLDLAARVQLLAPGVPAAALGAAIIGAAPMEEREVLTHG